MPQFISRMIRAARLDATLYDEVKNNTTAMKQAIGIVFLTFVAGAFSSFGRDGLIDAREVIAGLIFWFIYWFICAISLYLVGTEFTGEKRIRAEAEAMLRTVGFAFLPFIINILSVVPGISGIVPGFPKIVKIVAIIWVNAALIVAVRRTLDIRSIGRTIGVFIIAGIGGSAILVAINFMVFEPFIR